MLCVYVLGIVRFVVRKVLERGLEFMRLFDFILFYLGMEGGEGN